MCSKCIPKYFPHGFQFLLIKKGNKEIIKMFANFGDNWRLNSGVVSIEPTGVLNAASQEVEYFVKGHSGSVYSISRSTDGMMSLYCEGVLVDFLKQNGHNGLSIKQISLDEAIKLVKEQNA